MKPKGKRSAGQGAGKNAFSRFAKGPANKRPYSSKFGDGDSEKSYGGYSSFKKREPWRAERPAARNDFQEKKTTVPAQKLVQGIEQAKDEISDMAQAIGRNLKAVKNIKSIEIDLGFDGHGNFVGIGAGAAATVRISIAAE